MKHNSILLCLVFAITASFITPAAKAQVNTADSLALVDLYNSTNGPHWNRHHNWLTTNPVRTWSGVTLDSNRVTGLFLTFNNMSGPLPSSIGNLVYGSRFELNNNQLSGVIPLSIGNLVNLTWLSLGNNQLSGVIPSSIGKLVNLSILELNNNQLTGTIPASISKLINLTYLRLYYNQLSGFIPSSVGKLINLIYLGLYNNQLSGNIPASVGKLVNLQYLELESNQLSDSIPASLGHLTNLLYFSLNNNKLTGSVPASFKNLTKVGYLLLDHNQLSQSSNVDLPFTTHQYAEATISYNNFTFDGLESVSKKIHTVQYAPQAPIFIHQTGNSLSVYAGGTLSNNTYHWFKVGATDSTIIKGDSSFTPSAGGSYYAKVTNAIVTKLVLYSDTISYTMPVAQTNNSIAKAADVKTGNTHFSVYPNPASNLIHIQTTGTATIILTNAAGKTLLTKTINNSADINVSTYANGTYYIQNKTTGETQKIVVVH